jgi:hypothetical protein
MHVINEDLITDARKAIKEADKKLFEDLSNRIEVKKSTNDYFIDTLKANIDNKKLSYTEFREFVKNSLK